MEKMKIRQLQLFTKNFTVQLHSKPFVGDDDDDVSIGNSKERVSEIRIQGPTRISCACTPRCLETILRSERCLKSEEIHILSQLEETTIV